MSDAAAGSRVSQRHPELSDDDIRSAWRNAMAALPRTTKAREELAATGADPRGRLVEMVAVRTDDGGWLVYHAFTPPTRKMLAELGMTRR